MSPEKGTISKAKSSSKYDFQGAILVLWSFIKQKHVPRPNTFISRKIHDSNVKKYIFQALTIDFQGAFRTFVRFPSNFSQCCACCLLGNWGPKSTPPHLGRWNCCAQCRSHHQPIVRRQLLRSKLAYNSAI